MAAAESGFIYERRWYDGYDVNGYDDDSSKDEPDNHRKNRS